MSQVSIIDIESNNPQIPTNFIADIGSAVPIANTLEILGDTVPAGVLPVYTTGSGNTITTNVQIAQAIAASNALNVGLAAFDSASFTVDSNGFVSFIGGGGTVTEFNVDASTAPGTDPVLPTVGGDITVTGAQVASGTVGSNVIRTNSLSANTYTIEIQRSTAAAASALAINGVSHFNSSSFTVDGNGFVSLSGTGTAQTITGNTGTATPTAGNINVVTANSTVKFVGSASTVTQDFNLTNLIMGSNASSIGAAIFNVGLGAGSTLNAVTSGGGNVAIGYGNLPILTTGSNNTFIGEGCAALLTSSINNTGVGVGVLQNLATGAGFNIAMGYAAGGGITTGAHNISIGVSSSASYASSESDNIIIGNAGVVGESNIIRIGTQGGGATGTQTQCYLAGVLNTVSGRVIKVTTPGAYPYTTLITDELILVNTSSARTIIPLASPVTGTRYVIKDNIGSAAANNITITPSGKNIDGAASYIININYGSITIVYNGTEWSII